MPLLSEQVQALCDDIFSSKVARAAAVTNMKEAVANVKEEVAAFRERVQDEQRAATDQLRQNLTQNQQERKQIVESMLEGFDQVQQAFADQCQAATRIWREMKERRLGNG
jgi:DNA anti-recombination protein RmuC